MAGNAGVVALLGDSQQHHISIAIDADFVHQLHMAGFFALVPQLVALAAEIHRTAQLHRFLQRLPVHPGKPQHVLAALLLGDDGHQALGVPCDCV